MRAGGRLKVGGCFAACRRRLYFEGYRCVLVLPLRGDVEETQ